MNDTPKHLTLVDPNNACYKVAGTLVWGEWWKDYPNDSYGCKTTDQQTAYNTCSDEDINWYVRLDDPTSVGVTPTEINLLQRWSQCKAGYTDPSKWCNFLTETIPQGGNYGMWDPTKYDWDPTNDQPQLPNICLDEDFNPNTTENNPCKDKNIRVSFTGARVFDNNHGWKEIHPVRKEVWTDSGGSSKCYSVNDADQASPRTCTDTNSAQPATLSLAASPNTVDYNGTTTLTGKLSTSSGTVSGKTVTVWSSPDTGKTWTQEGQTTSDASGNYTYTTSPLTRNTTYQVRFDGDSWYQKATSSNVSVKARAKLSTPSTPDVVKQNASFTVSGEVWPYQPGSYTYLYFYYYYPGWGYYQYSSQQVPNSSYLDHAQYTLNSKLASTGKWKVQAYHPADAYNEATWSSPKEFKVSSTKLALSASSSTVDYDGTTTLTGKLTDPTDPVADKTLTVWKSTDNGTSWSQDGTATYDAASKSYTYTTGSLKQNTTFQMRFDGDSSYEKATSSNLSVKVRASLPAPTMTSDVVKSNTEFSVSGEVWPYHAGDYTYLYFYYYYPGFGYYQYSSQRVPNSSYLDHGQYTLKTKLASTGKWKVQPYRYADTYNEATWGSPKEFTVQ